MVLRSETEIVERTMTNRTEPPSVWLTASEAAAYLKVKVRTLLLWTRQGKVKAYALSGTKRRVWRFRQADLDTALMESAVLVSVPPSVCPAERMGK
jgi:excisionase family DNA binding protein